MRRSRCDFPHNCLTFIHLRVSRSTIRQIYIFSKSCNFSIQWKNVSFLLYPLEQDSMIYSIHRSALTLDSQECPHTWCTANISLIFKSGDSAVPSNFRPIALISVLGKIFHKILASRLEQYAIDSEVIDPSTQKGFLIGINSINGMVELSMSAILEHARGNGLPGQLLSLL